MKIIIAQIGIDDNQIEANTHKVIDIVLEHQNSDIVLFPELAITGFPESTNLKKNTTLDKKPSKHFATAQKAYPQPS